MDDGSPSGLEARRRAAGKAANASYSKRVEDVVSAAAVLFTEKGYEATTLSDIAAALGIDRATLYYYFKSKSEILKTAISSVKDEGSAELARINGLVADVPTKVGLVIARLVGAFEESYPYASLALQDSILRSADPDQTWVAAMFKDTRNLAAEVRKIIEEGQDDGSLRRDVPADLLTKLVLSVNWTYRWFRPNRGYDAAEISNAFTSVLVQGMRPAT